MPKKKEPPLADPLLARTLCGTLLARITHATKFVALTLSDNHSEEIRFLLIHSPTAPVVLVHTWLAKYNPHIDWALNSVLGWSSFCLAQCLSYVFSHRLTPPERNYDIGNRELLAVKLALEEWHHWLEGIEVPFIVWTDHKNLEYIRTAHRLNSRQARWALFFGRFRFTISYRPGSKNGKPKALSQIFEAEASPTLPVPILPHERAVVAVTWGVESKVRTALRDTTISAGCPEGLLFVPESVRTSVLQWGH